MTYVTIPGRSPETTEALKRAASYVGVAASEIRAGAVGYIVPAAVSEHYRKMVLETPEEPEKSSFPDSSWKNDEIKAWAESHEVDLGDATKKADMLAAIQSADTKEE
jgi:hypothetical protein